MPPKRCLHFAGGILGGRVSYTNFSSLKNTQEKAAQRAEMLSVLPFAFANANSVVIE